MQAIKYTFNIQPVEQDLFVFKRFVAVLISACVIGASSFGYVLSTFAPEKEFTKLRISELSEEFESDASD